MATAQYSEAEIQVESIINNPKLDSVEINVKASCWQVLGTTYSKNKKHEKAFHAFDTSIDLYKKAIKTFGMNVIDGLYHLYESYAWTYSDINDYQHASEIFSICVSLATTYDLDAKQASAFFDYGYSLIMCSMSEDAVKVLAQHYSLIVERKLIPESDMPFIHGNLAFAHWYAGAFIDAVELIGLYILSCWEENIRPVISILEKSAQSDELDTLKFFEKRMYVFIIPVEKSLTDFENWINRTVAKRPELKEALSDFHYFKKGEN
ncbi:tetratricopeptide repeat protein [Pseudoflavitalea rhizosphaerae]|uniref:tetratricopeptide repeat protein n=1 Tax=Pseudoflavitalea rhizosphaerae TaxID=1884793 RepID=UPI000F8F5D2D|nr:hypothetical protein [Pseudoflavitalea rhizosphaerae]